MTRRVWPGRVTQSVGHLTRKSGGPGFDTRSGNILSFHLPLFQEGQLSVTGESMCTNRIGGLSLPRKNVVRLTDRPDMTLDVYRGRKTTIQDGCVMKLLSLEMDSSHSTVFKSDVFLTKFGHKLLLSLSAQPDYV